MSWFGHPKDDPKDHKPTDAFSFFGWSWAYGEADRHETGDRATRSWWSENKGDKAQREKAVRARARGRGR